LAALVCPFTLIKETMIAVREARIAARTRTVNIPRRSSWRPALSLTALSGALTKRVHMRPA
jgi:hypothetical protein